MQIGHGTRSDCVLAETFLRLDHLEDAIHAVKHEEMLNGMMMRMDHLAQQIEHVQDFTVDAVEEAQRRESYKDQVCCALRASVSIECRVALRRPPVCLALGVWRQRDNRAAARNRAGLL